MMINMIVPVITPSVIQMMTMPTAYLVRIAKKDNPDMSVSGGPIDHGNKHNQYTVGVIDMNNGDIDPETGDE